MRIHAQLRRNETVEMVDDQVAVDQRHPVIQHQRRHAQQRVVCSDLVGLAEGRPGPVLEGDAVERQRDADAADEGRVVLSDQDHGT